MNEDALAPGQNRLPNLDLQGTPSCRGFTLSQSGQNGHVMFSTNSLVQTERYVMIIQRYVMIIALLSLRSEIYLSLA